MWDSLFFLKTNTIFLKIEYNVVFFFFRNVKSDLKLSEDSDEDDEDDSDDDEDSLVRITVYLIIRHKSNSLPYLVEKCEVSTLYYW